eukprot:CAMPEP_0185724322 /NCGR_PEP_ID=MMETSP1171-20130828/833_1 /TAXON_ID=374046 /ORGANISM="Helicotheca tamensis, Strain CCMP826" /LENGTH=239 /DNA_ID=CAMNT_0028392145 /DNA_START=44 /DNA_END=763 /DNA_ORIENTATION=+
MSSSTAPKSVIIFCHGSGDTGAGVKSYVEAVAPPESLRAVKEAGIELIYPTAQPRPYRLAGNMMSSVWFDRHNGMDPGNPEDTKSVEPSTNQLNQLIDDLVSQEGIPANKIALGGFSMGGGIALQTAARCNKHGHLGAIFTLSSYLCQDSRIYTLLAAQKQQIDTEHKNCALLKGPVFMAHGTTDDFVSITWGQKTATKLIESGVNVLNRQVLPIHNAGHEMTTSQLQHLFHFLIERLK